MQYAMSTDDLTHTIAIIREYQLFIEDHASVLYNLMTGILVQPADPIYLFAEDLIDLVNSIEFNATANHSW